jgi:hypothetical protein
MTNAPVLDATLVRQIGLRRPANPPNASNTTRNQQDSSASSTESSTTTSAADVPEVLTRDDFGTLAQYEEYIRQRSASNHRVSEL